MEIRGEEFIKKVQLKQEKEEIEQRLNEINNAESIYEEPEKTVPPRLDREIEIQEEQEYSDIMLGKSPTSNEINKKKYLVLGLILVILFLLTIIIIRLLNNDSTKDDSFSKSQNTASEKVLENENIEEQYQKIINEKLKNIKNENEKEVIKEEKIDEKLNLQKIEEKEIEEAVKEAKPDVFEIKKTEPIYVPPKKKALVEPKIEKKVEKEKPKPIVKKEVKKTTPVVKKATPKPAKNSSITTSPKGTFVQVGAFSKMPNNKYLSDITKKGFKYKVYKVTINNKLFHKVLIGPYQSRGQAKLATENIKKKLNISGAFILTF
ncbi:SPOR domain-containing protein [Arcobacter sp. LA11]|uniref:SPOR domain-containing protein n=1 Tax=Arcobacter sp. LA11 TaxID=1898176 RepID=UPI000934F572|nr:SPOR domain-containing protein [Arcobacter sp. LA11]